MSCSSKAGELSWGAVGTCDLQLGGGGGGGGVTGDAADLPLEPENGAVGGGVRKWGGGRRAGPEGLSPQLWDVVSAPG